MAIIEQDAERQLARALKLFLRDPAEAAGLRFRFAADRVDPIRSQSVLAACLESEGVAGYEHIYVLQSGEIFVLVPHAQIGKANRLAIQVAKILGLTPLECGFSFLNLHEQAGRLLEWLEASLVQIEQNEAAARAAAAQRQQEQAQRQRKRQAILTAPADAGTRSRIERQRRARAHTEIMVIEDDAFSRRLVEGALKDYRIVGLGDTEVALATYMRTAPDVLFLDIDLPAVTGHELLEKIMLVDPAAYVVMLSGNADRANVTAAMKLGAKGFVAKPFTPGKLLHYIQNCPTVH